MLLSALNRLKVKLGQQAQGHHLGNGPWLEPLPDWEGLVRNASDYNTKGSYFGQIRIINWYKKL